MVISISQKKAQTFYAQPNINEAIKVWNTMEKNIFYQALKLTLPSTKYVQKIYIDNVTNQDILQQQNQPKFEIIRINDEENFYKKQLFKFNKQKIQIRILSSHKLVKPNSQTTKFFNKIILHVHGGGFVSMGTRSHQTYTRKWANKLGIPIFAVDYKKAPQHPYPYGLNDCWQAYLWILFYAEKFFNVKPEKIILVGDSAGGNLILGLVQLCIKFNIQLPSGIIPVYPALNLHIHSFTPSNILALEDQILPHMYLKLIQKAYLQDKLQYADSDPLISPIIIPDQVLQKFPRCRFSIGLNDPLTDETFRFLERLIKNGVDAKIIAYKNMPHGYLNYDNIGGMKCASICVQDVCDLIKELVD
ncbi:hypothetical protein IMG5_141700 [Ichthyophthirius multifiliis]|uniref:Alpha/beta hydrolase fold-3 domain-containing protein n=1 Tax=Ichthyophthirius multifiliis TaxID=5932 RepID=G0QXE0_ICHMU|nr:hypothetical protein IMG5_141700 [Ichthyophthirius multifiliis]EGR30114.1 hypothetical protein IMG5_141700 [Ichthyophthirius multifiliis]|eukprot:XP_004031350.1 hypothetical protein IMG5_141700 [Ichthyophthirius multifiliis]